jgi:hypothetical protein
MHYGTFTEHGILMWFLSLLTRATHVVQIKLFCMSDFVELK